MACTENKGGSFKRFWVGGMGWEHERKGEEVKQGRCDVRYACLRGGTGVKTKLPWAASWCDCIPYSLSHVPSNMITHRSHLPCTYRCSLLIFLPILTFKNYFFRRLSNFFKKNVWTGRTFFLQIPERNFKKKIASRTLGHPLCGQQEVVPRWQRYPSKIYVHFLEAQD
jgi:hypothetical protein